MDQVYLNLLKSRYLSSINKEPVKEQEKIEVSNNKPKEDTKDDINELKEKLNHLIQLKESNKIDKETKKIQLVNKKCNGNPSERAKKMREAKDKKKMENMEKLLKEIEGKDPEQVKKELNEERKKIVLLKKIISDV